MGADTERKVLARRAVDIELLAVRAELARVAAGGPDQHHHHAAFRHGLAVKGDIVGHVPGGVRRRWLVAQQLLDGLGYPFRVVNQLTPLIRVIGENLSGLIDFYFACNDALAYDLAICLSAWCFEPDNAFNVSKGRAMISAYERLRPLGEAEIEALPVLARGAALRVMLTQLVDWLNVPPGAKVAPKNPLEYRDKLRFHQRVRSAVDYGLTR